MEQIAQTGAGLLQERVAFDMRTEVDDGYGNTVSDWAPQFSIRAQFMHLRGGESVVAARLEGRQPIVVRIRTSSDARRIGTDWRMRDVRTAKEYNIRSVTPDPSRAVLDLLVESGGAT